MIYDDLRKFIPEEHVAAFDDMVDNLESDCADLKEQVESLQEERESDVRYLEEVLEQLQHWFHNFLVLGRPVSPMPRQMMRMVDDALR